MKKFLTLILCLAMVFAFTACGGGGSSAGGEDFVATACIASEPETIDPSLISSVDGSTYVNHMFENLMKYVPTDEKADESGNVMKYLMTDSFIRSRSEKMQSGLTVSL